MIDKSFFYRLKIFTLNLFVFSIFFENWKPFDVSFTIVKFIGIIYVLLSLGDLKSNFNLKFNKKIILSLILLWIWLILRSMLNYWEGNSVDAFHFSFLQNILFLWLFTNDIIRNPRILKWLLISYIAGVSILGLLILNGVGIETNAFYESNRITFFGANSNNIGNWCAIGIILILGIIMTKIPINFIYKTLMVLSIPVLTAVIMSTGSRGALLGLGAGVLVLFSGFRSKLYVKILYLVSGFFSLYYLNDFIENSEVMSKRIALFLETGDEARMNIWKDSINIIYDNPFFGLGNTGFESEMLLRYGYFLDTHNIFLYFLVSGGIIALGLYIYMLYNIFLNILKNKIRNTMLLPLALFVIYIIIVFKGGGILNEKSPWLILGLAYVFLAFCQKI